MKKRETYAGDPVHGLIHLTSSRERGRSVTLEQYFECRRPHMLHPISELQADAPPAESTYHRRYFEFTGGGNKGYSASCFIGAICNKAGFEDGLRVKGLRVISAPFTDNDPEHHYVFFEAWIGNTHLVSGETTDFPEGTRRDMVMLEDVFALLAQTYGIVIERISVEHVEINDLYDEEAAV